MPTKNMRTRDSPLAKIVRPREKTRVPIRVILRFRELCIVNDFYWLNAWFLKDFMLPFTPSHAKIDDLIFRQRMDLLFWSPGFFLSILGT